MPIYQVVVLAVVQALTEFLPISSTAHLALVPWLLKWKDPGLTFDVALHLGTLVAVLIYFWRQWIRIAFAGFGLRPPISAAAHTAAAEVPASTPNGQAVAARCAAEPDQAVADGRLLWLLALGTVPAVIVGLGFEDYIRTTLRSPYVMAATMILVALVMAYGERVSRQTRGLRDVGATDALLVGVAQAAALVPGVSRSGSTITVAMLRDYRRDSAARFSFLLATPAVAGAAAKEGFDLLRQGIPADMRLPFVLGIVVAGVTGYAVISFFIRYLQTRTLKIFVYYRVVFGLIILALAIFSSAP